MRIILEGPDGSGKSTLAKKLRSAFGYPIHHFSYPKTKYEKENLAKIYRKFLSEHDDVIIDRMWYSTLVYGPIMRGKSEVTLAQSMSLEIEYKPLVIYCTGNPLLLWERCKKRGEDYVSDPNKFLQICERYDALMLEGTHVVPIYVFDTTKEEIDGKDTAGTEDAGHSILQTLSSVDEESVQRKEQANRRTAKRV